MYSPTFSSRWGGLGAWFFTKSGLLKKSQALVIEPSLSQTSTTTCGTSILANQYSFSFRAIIEVSDKAYSVIVTPLKFQNMNSSSTATLLDGRFTCIVNKYKAHSFPMNHYSVIPLFLVFCASKYLT